MPPETPATPEHYNAEYTRRYIESTLSSLYTIYKNRVLAETARDSDADFVLDLGCNVSPTIRQPGSLRFQMENQGIRYGGLDISPQCFDKDLIASLKVPLTEIYEDIMGIVGDVINIPIADSSVDAITCADVLEHIRNPGKAFREIARILTEDGLGLIIIPSMYKLDTADFPHIKKRRKSSHESRLTNDDWKQEWEQAGLETEYEKSRPLGLASGLSYLTWLDEEFVPERRDLDGEETYSEKSLLHKQAKKILSQYDPIIDDLILDSADLSTILIETIQNGDITGVFEMLKVLIDELQIPQEEQEVLNRFFDTVSTIQFDPSRITKLRVLFMRHDNPLLLAGNSTLVVLRKTGNEAESADHQHT